MQLLVVTLLIVASVQLSEQIVCPGLGEFLPVPPHEGWPDPACIPAEGLNLTYTLFTSTNAVDGVQFDRGSIPSAFRPDLYTSFVIHGWLGDSNDLWLNSIKTALLNQYDMNVVTVGWGGPNGAGDPNYAHSASTTRTVGAWTAELIMEMINKDELGSSARFHCAGHSLGAHTCGAVGRWTIKTHSTSLHRITGLDPAGPMFANNSEPTVGIYKDCGNFVDIIHTDSSLGSTPIPGDSSNQRTSGLGHLDIYVNNGQDQPGCGGNTCSHARAPLLYIDSIESGNCNTTMLCTAADRLPSSCNACVPYCDAPMGYETNRTARGMYTLYSTALSAPYCQP